jgi:ribosome-binding factor A
VSREFSRSRRVEQQIQRALGELLLLEVKDPRVRGVSITAVDVSRDLGVAQAWFSLLDPEADPANAQAGLDAAAGFLRAQLGRELTLRRTPELRFAHDASIRRGSELSRLIDEARRRDDRG